MKLFTLEAELSLDTSKFDDGVSSAKGSLTGLQSDITSTDSVMEALDKEIADLEDEIANLELDLDIDDLEDEIDALNKDIQKQDFKSSFMEGFYSGLSDAAGDLLQEAIKAGFDFLADSVETASNSGTAAAEEYNKAVARISVGTENLKSAIGNKLLPILTTVYDSFASLLGVSDWEMSVSMLDQLEAYEFENLRKAEESLKNIFSFGESYVAEDLDLNFDSVLAGFESQTEFWKQYSQTLEDLQARGIGSDLLSQYATGTKEDYSRLSWLSSLTDDQLSALAEASSAVDAARYAAAEELSLLQLMNDSTYGDLVEQYNSFMDTLDRGGGRRFGDPQGAEARTDSNITGVLQTLNSSISALNSKMGALGSVDIHNYIDGQEVASSVAPRLLRELSWQVNVKSG